MPPLPPVTPRPTPASAGTPGAAAGAAGAAAPSPPPGQLAGPIESTVGDHFEKAGRALGSLAGMLGLPGSQAMGQAAVEATRIADAVLREAQKPPIVQEARKLADWAKQQLEDPYALDTDYSKYRKPAHDAVEKQSYRYKEGDWKCNVFIGDVLSQTGFEPALSDKGRYSQAESLPRKGVFTPVTDLRDLQPGDVLVLDYPGSGGATAHVEIVTDVERDAQGRLTRVTSIGGRGEGVVENDAKGALLVAGQDSPKGKGFKSGEDTLYVIRPSKGGGAQAPLQEGTW